MSAEAALPLVSIVIPCYRGARFLAEAIGSCLRQECRSLEVIVVDDASPDDCAEIAERFAARDSRVRVLRLPKNRGVAGAFNAGFHAARGQLFTRLAQDDLFREDAIVAMAGHLADHPDVGLVYCDMQLIDSEGRVLREVRTPEAEGALVGGNKIGLCVMWRREVWEKTGEFRSGYDSAEDYDYWVRASRHCRFERCPRGAPFFFRKHEAMGSREFSAKQEVLAARIEAGSANHGVIARRKILARGHFNAAYNSREKGCRRDCVRHLAAAVWQWPFSPKPYRCALGLLRDIARVRRA